MSCHFTSLCTVQCRVTGFHMFPWEHETAGIMSKLIVTNSKHCPAKGENPLGHRGPALKSPVIYTNKFHLQISFRGDEIMREHKQGVAQSISASKTTL